MKFDKAYSLLCEMVADAPPPPPMIKFDSAPVDKPKHFTSNIKSFDVSTTSKDQQKQSSANPSFSEYTEHFIKYEDKVPVPYKDSRGFFTVGIGHKFEKGEPIKSKYSEEEIMRFFKKDLAEAIEQTKKVFPNFESLPKDVKIKLVSLTFNMGMGGIAKFKDFRSAIAKKDWKSAAYNLKDSLWYKQVGNRGRDYVAFFTKLT